MVLVVANEKGGVGKSTIAVNLAILRRMAGKDVLVVDADTQGSSQEFFYVRESSEIKPDLRCMGIIGKSVGSEVRKLVDKFDDIVIDVGGRDSTGFRNALMVADKLLIPVLPGQLDIWALEKVNELVEEAQAINVKLKAFVVINKNDTNPRIKLADEAGEFIQKLNSVTPLKTRIGYRVSYRRSIAEGKSVKELTPREEKAENEMSSLYAEVFGDETQQKNG